MSLLATSASNVALFLRNMKAFGISSILIPFFFAFVTPFSARNSIKPTQPLADNETLISSGGQFALGFFTPNNSRRRYIGIWFNKMDQRIVWVANRASPVIYSPGLLSITANGTMMITDKWSSIIWSTDTTGGLTSSVAQLLDDGNLVVREDSNNTQRYAWQSFDYPTDSLLAGMKLGQDRTTGLIRNLTAWNTDTDPSEGEYTVAQDTDTYTYIYSRSGKFWRNGQLDDIDLRNKGLKYSHVQDSQEVSFSFQASELPMIFVITRSGKVQWLTSTSDLKEWHTSWERPTNQCDFFGKCGPNGICDISTQPICSCIQGFVPKNPAKWVSADWADGCMRKTRLDCRNRTDGFALISVAKIPDSPISFRYKDFSLDECRLMCLQNCSCTAYGTYTWEDGCVIWVTNSLLDVAQIDGLQLDLYVRIASADLVLPTQSHKRKAELLIILATLLSGLILLIACLSSFLWKRKRRRRAISSATKFSNDKSDESNADHEFLLFDFCTIETATNYFRDENILGHGGFGTVYKGKLSNGQEIAVKRLARTSLQGNDEFKNEVKIIAKLQNRNLVRLHGSCIQGEERMLIYEYMPNKSLDFFLFDKGKCESLDWQTRYKIITGIARGLLYLHHDSRFRIIHRDLKASNILLDEEMNPKISDFGMARFFCGDETDFRTRKVVGTYGYMSPEYAMGGLFSLKSDVFSYGVLILEVISGKKNSGLYTFSPFINLTAHAWSLWNEGKALELLDESMSSNFSMNDVLRCIKVGLLCVQEHPEDRPLMSSVIVMLGTDVTSLPEPKQPGFITIACPSYLDQNSRMQDPPATNDLTITLDAR